MILKLKHIIHNGHKIQNMLRKCLLVDFCVKIKNKQSFKQLLFNGSQVMHFCITSGGRRQHSLCFYWICTFT